MRPTVTMRKALADKRLLGSALEGDSWSVWRTMLVATMGEPLTADELEVFQRVTGRKVSPPSRVEEAIFVIGRRGGKDRAASVLAGFLGAFVDWSPVLAPGESGRVICVGADQRQAKVQRDYIEGVLESSAMLSKLVASQTADAIELTNGISIEVRAANFRRLRGPTAVAVIATEAAFWHSDENSANTDTEILSAARPMLATTRGPLVIISSPYARRGELWNLYRRHYGEAGDPLILVAQGASRDFNPTLPQRVVDRALERDVAAASAEYLGLFRADLEVFVSREVVEAAIDPGVHERAPIDGQRYFGFVDPSGGASDAMTLAIAHDERRVLTLDAVRERRPPFSPEAVVAEFGNLLKRYRIATVHGDRYAGEWPREAFARHNINYRPADRTKSELYRDVLPELNSRSVALLDNSRIIAQFCSLERRTSRAGRDVIDHPPSAHDDVANAVAGALLLAKPHAAIEMGIGRPVQIDAGPPFLGLDLSEVPMAERPSVRDWLSESL